MRRQLLSGNSEGLRGIQRLVIGTAAGVALPLSYLPPLHIARILKLFSRRSRPADYALVLRIREEVCLVSVRCAGQGCLQRSIAVFLACRVAGSAPDWCTGFLNRPFIAHAWVEVDGRPVGESGELEDFATMVSVRPNHTQK